MKEKNLAELLYETSRTAPARIKAEAAKEEQEYIARVVNQCIEDAKKEAPRGRVSVNSVFNPPEIYGSTAEFQTIGNGIVSALMCQGFCASATLQRHADTGITKVYVHTDWAKAGKPWK